MRAIPINQTAPFKNFLTSSALAVGNVVALNSSGLLVKADKSNANLLNVMGVVLTASPGGSVVTIPVLNQGIAQNSSWSFISGSPVYLASNGNVTQDTSSFSSSDWIVELGTAIGVNQMTMGIRRAVANTATHASPYAVSSGAVYDALAGKVSLGSSITSGKLAIFTNITTVGSADTLTLPETPGTIMTDSSDIIGEDYM
jgi:hypothetical protein